MIIKDITKIPCSFLRNVLEELSGEYKFKDVYIDPNGELALRFWGMLSENEIKDILQRITPGDVLPEDFIPRDGEDYDVMTTDLGVMTQVFSKEGINYRTL